MAISVPAPDARGLSDDTLDTLRLCAIRAMEKGLAECDAADILGVSRETISHWWCAFRSGGLDALPHERTGRPVGSGRLLSEDQARRVQEVLDARLPQEVGIPAALWTRGAVRALILQECGIDMPVRTVGSYLARWGYTCKKPRRRAAKQNPDDIDIWLKTTYPAIAARAAHEGAEIHWGDETGVLADHHPARGYARKGQPATMAVPDPHLRVNVIATITNQGEGCFMTYTKTMTAALFIVFLEKLIASSERKIFLIVDHLPAHEARLVTNWLAAHRDRIEMFFLPRRAPELNAEEYLNNDLKANVHASGLPTDKPTLQSRVQTFMKKLMRIGWRIRRYFQHPMTQYAM